MNYNLTFNEAMEILFKKEGWVQGENFAKDAYLDTLDNVVTLNTIDKQFSFAKYSYNVPLTKGLMTQKFRIITVLNYKQVTGFDLPK